MSGSPPPPTHEVLSESPSCTRTCLRGRYAADYEGNRVSSWVQEDYGHYRVNLSALAPWWKFRWGILLTGYSAVRELVGHDL